MYCRPILLDLSVKENFGASAVFLLACHVPLREDRTKECLCRRLKISFTSEWFLQLEDSQRVFGARQNVLS